MTKNTAMMWLMGLCSLVVMGVFIFVDPIPQDINYHLFADQRRLCVVPHTLNVFSNLPFLVVGMLGCYQVSQTPPQYFQPKTRLLYWLLFAGVAAVCFGSGYYHWDPHNRTLVWDRLPMTVAFMALFCIIISENISAKWGTKLFVPLLLIGMGSVIYWHFTEQQGRGDLRPYAIVQFLPMIAIPIILLRQNNPFGRHVAFWAILFTYLLAKFCEYFDTEIYQLLGFVSGHSIKHILPAIGLYCLIRHLQRPNLE